MSPNPPLVELELPVVVLLGLVEVRLEDPPSPRTSVLFFEAPPTRC